MKVVIVGGGFGGVRTALKLANKSGIEVVLISSQTYFEYHAALYRSATGRSPLEVAIPLKDFFVYAKNVEVIEDCIVDIDNQNKYVIGETESKYKYDNLILALGNETEFYGIKGLGEYAYGVKTIHEALKLKRHIHEQLLMAESDKNYVVIGAGATGTELSAELAAYLKKVRKKHKIKNKFIVTLIEGQERVLPAMPEKFTKIVEKRLLKLGVKLLLNTKIESETLNTIKLSNGSIKSQTVVWTAGISNNKFFKYFPNLFNLGKLGRVIVDDYLQAADCIYIIGDSALTKYSGMAQTALHDADYVTKNIINKLNNKNITKYTNKKPVYAVPVGSRWAAVLWGRAKIYGRFGWLLRRLADLRLYLNFLPFKKALTVWRYGFIDEEICPVCKQ